jgi:PPOX class probable F420-dependent enzyme
VHLVTLHADGRPHVTVVWSAVEDGEIVIAHLREHQKVRNVRRDGRVALSIATGDRNANGLDEYVVVDGNARITEGGAVDLLQAMVKRYAGPDATYPVPEGAPTGYVTRVVPTKVTGLSPLVARSRG